ncbi:hypothetical protein [Sodalis-like endosymbiont of Proechinophthirus fluctus]|uniref:hypothetical protein n=1 Tax=Sodalis-like endosymbiont of Proechinophthirus fluctus TaxID=1462730 RepID=UPI000835AA87|nr:hypothetical protein [Sodalis-like endosymbiont of Proechinophthirus fluctus]
MLEAEISLVLFLHKNHGTQAQPSWSVVLSRREKIIGQFNSFKMLSQQLTNGKSGKLSLGLFLRRRWRVLAIITAFQNAFQISISILSCKISLFAGAEKEHPEWSTAGGFYVYPGCCRRCRSIKPARTT